MGQAVSCFGLIAWCERRMPVREFDCLRLGTAMARAGVRSQVPGVSRQPGPADCAGPLKIPGELPPRKGDAPWGIHHRGTEGRRGKLPESGRNTEGGWQSGARIGRRRAAGGNWRLTIDDHLTKMIIRRVTPKGPFSPRSSEDDHQRGMPDDHRWPSRHRWPSGVCHPLGHFPLVLAKMAIGEWAVGKQ